MGADRGEDELFWTDLTRQGCAGQFSACMSNGSSEYKVSRIHSTPFDGNCVAINGNEFTTFIYKTMQCKERLPIVCIGEVLLEKSMAKYIPQIAEKDINEFGIRDLQKSYEWNPDVIYGDNQFS
jgi:hypothetical protein